MQLALSVFVVWGSEIFVQGPCLLFMFARNASFLDLLVLEEEEDILLEVLSTD